MNSTVIIGIILLLILLVPAYIVIQRQQREKKKLRAFLSTIEKQEKIKISEFENWRNKLIGVDLDSLTALFIIRDNETNQVVTVDLHDISGCSVDKEIVTADGDSSIQAIATIRLRFRPRYKSQSEKAFLLYNELDDTALGNELRIADKWVLKFNELIKKIKLVA